MNMCVFASFLQGSSDIFFFFFHDALIERKRIEESIKLIFSVIWLKQRKNIMFWHVFVTCKCIWDVVFDFDVDKHGGKNQRLILLISQADVTITYRDNNYQSKQNGSFI